MWVAIFTLGLIAFLSIAGITGFGARDSRDVSVSLFASPRERRCAHENLVAPQSGRRR